MFEAMTAKMIELWIRNHNVITRSYNKGFIGDGAVVFYLIHKGRQP
jgi:hypothetical protein